jgi:hypothetical protein
LGRTRLAHPLLHPCHPPDTLASYVASCNTAGSRSNDLADTCYTSRHIVSIKPYSFESPCAYSCEELTSKHYGSLLPLPWSAFRATCDYCCCALETTSALGMTSRSLPKPNANPDSTCTSANIIRLSFWPKPKSSPTTLKSFCTADHSHLLAAKIP